MFLPSKKELRDLLSQQNGPYVSIYLPTDRTGLKLQQDQRAFSHAIREAENSLLLHNLPPGRAKDLLKPLEALLEDEQFWLYLEDGLALFCSPGLLQYYKLPYNFKARVVVSNSFYIKPLLPSLTGDGRYFILALSQNAIRLLEATHYSVTSVPLPQTVPHSLAEALKYEQSENLLEQHSSASGATIGKGGRHPAIVHGQGIGIDDSKDKILRYFQQIDRGLHGLLKGQQTPLVLASVEYLFPIYRDANTYPHLFEHGLHGNPDHKSDEELHRQAWNIVQPYFLRTQQEAIARYTEYAGSIRTSTNMREITPAAYGGRIDTLFLVEDRELWGTFNPANGTLHIHHKARFADNDLLDVAASQTLLHRGTVYVVEQGEMPVGDMVAALFRY
ncbi:MAG TPA: hypothetical protein VJ761_19520 [Ktedonobacteraceae bacterium]|nr:hypothetical protein [Ktedonobacteraceae bacterium]